MNERAEQPRKVHGPREMENRNCDYINLHARALATGQGRDLENFLPNRAAGKRVHVIFTVEGDSVSRKSVFLTRRVLGTS